MTATQFPLKLAFACTAHKMQGITIPNPDPLFIDLKSVKEAAQAYVMMSRVQSLQQLYILNKFPNNKIYPSDIAKTELDRLNKIARDEKAPWGTTMRRVNEQFLHAYTTHTHKHARAHPLLFMTK